MPRKSTITFCFVSPRMSHSLPEVTMVLCMGNRKTDGSLAKPLPSAMKLEAMPSFWRLTTNTCELQDTTDIPPVSIISPLCVFSDISRMSFVKKAFQETCADFQLRFPGLQTQLVTHKTYDPNSQFHRQQFPFTLVLKFCVFFFSIHIHFSDLFFLSP